uniref:Uncharacterized protein n=1 Tax=Cyprinus carpio TaxID=7962 RepID=A0A8C1VDL8_CYPCA
MKDLLVDLIDASASKNPKLMLRRTESVVEKMVTNWMSICMYSYLKETVGEPFFLLLCAIKQQINKGSADAITGKARYTLNEEWLLRENVETKPQNIHVSFQGFGMDSVSVRVMNTDTIGQVKDKILEAFYKNLPFSQWPREEDVDLGKYHSRWTHSRHTHSSGVILHVLCFYAKPPLAVKYFFDFLEEQADKRGITDPDTLHIWKTNSLPLRFWVNILKNPQFVFDIDKTDHMDASLQNHVTNLKIITQIPTGMTGYHMQNFTEQGK